MRQFSYILSLGLLLIGIGVSCSQLRAGTVPKTEVYGLASDGTVLHWEAYTPSTPGPWPAVLVIHGGGFAAGSPDSSPESVTCAQDLAAAGYIAFSIEYRLAPPGFIPGQKSAGRFPDQSNDVKEAVRAARTDPRCNTQVGAVGGSSGGYLVAFAAATGTSGEDRIDVGVSLSGAYDFSDFSPNPNIFNFTDNVLNYVDVPSTDVTSLRAASPAWLADRSVSPLLLVNTLEDPMPYIQIADFMTHLDAVGATNYQALSLSGGSHSFANWPPAKTTALAFLAANFAGTPLPPPLPSPVPADLSKKLINVSARSNVGTGDKVMVGGFIVTGTTGKRVVLRGIGPSLGQAGVSGALANPTLTLYDAAGTLIESNDNRLLLTGVSNPLLPSNSNESFLTAILPEGSYTAVLQGVNNTTGVGLIELYDVKPGSSHIGNISTRCSIASSGDVIIAGFIIEGTESTEVIARALGPSLAAFGVANPLSNPVLEIYDENGAEIASNDNWRSTQEQQIAATIPPTNDQEAAVVATLAPGNYTALVHDATYSPGIGLVEVYNLEP
ncbi:MAG: alpha/beta hydrolase family protein [Chthoniobacterales bacterium]